jgi:ssDNA-binding Zn-finger/Zn-ribbon topoisomerase 1
VATTPTFLQNDIASRSGTLAMAREERSARLYESLALGDPEADKTLRRVIGRVRQSGLDGRAMLERGWWQKLLYINGRQWIVPTQRGWADKRMARWIPRPVTNEMKLAVQTIRAMATKSIPSVRVRPNGNNPVNVITAQMADDLHPSITEEHRMPSRWFEADFWAPAVGTLFFHPHWDRDQPTHSTFVVAKQCPNCGFQTDPLEIDAEGWQMCPRCEEVPIASMTDVQDQYGPVGETVKLGGGVTDVVSPLEILIPGYYQRWEDVGELIRYRWRPKSWYEGRPYADKLSYSDTGGQALQMFRQLSLMTDQSTTLGGGGATGGSDGCVEAELWVKPCEEYPDGLWCRCAGGSNGETVIIRDEDNGIVPGPLPYRNIQGDVLWPWVYLPYEEVGGRLWAAGALDGVIQIQDKLNRNDSMVELIMQRMANPVWLEPKGAEVQRFTGEPGLIARYNIIAGSTAKPERLDGVNPGTAYFTLREQYIDDIRRMTGTREVLQGIQPGSDMAFSAMNLLVEQSQGMFTPYFKARGRAAKDCYLLQLELERSYGPIERVKPILGGTSTWTFQTFKRKDMLGAISVIVEDGTEAPKTTLGLRAALQQGKEFGVVPFNDPATANKTLEILGIPELVPSLDSHTKTAQVEQEEYVEWVRNERVDPTTGQPVPSPLKVMSTQNHQIHVQQLDLWANTDEIREMMLTDPAIEAEITLHRVEHLVAQQNPFGLPIPAAAQMAMQQVGGPAPGGGAPGAGPAEAEGAGRAMANSQQESAAIDTLPGAAPGGGNMGMPA